MVRDYELMYIVRPDLDDEALRAATESVGALVRGLGGEITKTSIWGRRRLAYEIDHLRDGQYVLAQVHLDGARVSELERALAIHDTVFRHLLVRRENATAATEDQAQEDAGGAQAGAEEALAAGDEAPAEDGDAEVPELMSDGEEE